MGFTFLNDRKIGFKVDSLKMVFVLSASGRKQGGCYVIR